MRILTETRRLRSGIYSPEHNVGTVDIFAIQLQVLQYLLAHQNKLETNCYCNIRQAQRNLYAGTCLATNSTVNSINSR
jgi:hypothetical protein